MEGQEIFSNDKDETSGVARQAKALGQIEKWGPTAM